MYLDKTDWKPFDGTKGMVGALWKRLRTPAKSLGGLLYRPFEWALLLVVLPFLVFVDMVIIMPSEALNCVKLGVRPPE